MGSRLARRPAGTMGWELSEAHGAATHPHPTPAVPTAMGGRTPRQPHTAGLLTREVGVVVQALAHADARRRFAVAQQQREDVVLAVVARLFRVIRGLGAWQGLTSDERRCERWGRRAAAALLPPPRHTRATRAHALLPSPGPWARLGDERQIRRVGAAVGVACVLLQGGQGIAVEGEEAGGERVEPRRQVHHACAWRRHVRTPSSQQPAAPAASRRSRRSSRSSRCRRPRSWRLSARRRRQRARATRSASCGAPASSTWLHASGRTTCASGLSLPHSRWGGRGQGLPGVPVRRRAVLHVGAAFRPVLHASANPALTHSWPPDAYLGAG